ncbi:MAG TPA: glycosyltransferase [Gaiellaceae bacterium]|nr:glycosyltransferase [Gaiellaceae bacterium]
MKILHIAQPTVGGLVSCVGDPVADQVRRGWDVWVACPPEGDLPEVATRAGASFRPWPAKRSPGPSSIGETRALGDAVREVGPDLVHLHSSKAGLCGRLALRGRLPTVFQPQAWSFHAAGGVVRWAAAAWERRGARWAHALVCASETERADGERAGIEAAWRVIYNGVDVEQLSAVGEEEQRLARERLRLEDGPLAVCVGRLSRQKGQDVLLDAWPAVRDRVSGAQLWLVGSGEDREELESRAVGGVSFAGERDDVPDWLAAADVVVQASRWEGMSLAILEAMARGRSIVTTEVAGNREALGEGAGAIVPPEHPAALAEEVSRRLADPALRAAEGRAARERAVRSHDVRKTTAQTAELYLELLGDASTKTREPGS